jgi:non-ribosomal peptide synthetase-like protein
VPPHRAASEQPPRFLHQFFEAQADARPDQIAVISPSRMMTYALVEKAANRLAHHLRANGIGPGSLVGLLLPRSADVYVGLLAILKAGAAYVPLDPDYPPERIGYILADCRAGFLVTTSALADKVQPADGALPLPRVLLDKQAGELAERPADRFAADEIGVTSDNLCYIIYTSGSTGKPKGVELEHRSVCNLVQVERELFGVRPDDRVFQGFSIAFDASVEEVWLAFAAGASLVIGTAEMVHAGGALANILTEARVTVWSTVPTLLSMQDQDVPTLRILILGGEACPPDLVSRWFRSDRRMYNTYGPTEGTVICTCWECVPGKPVTIGKPIPTYQILILDESLQPVPPGVAGELYIGGPGVARGYVGRTDLTAERFIVHPLAAPDRAGAPRLYKTGDLGRWAPDGEIEYLGRADSQVKLRGFRIELSEIENVLLECPGVKAAAVAVHQAAGVQQLVGYVVPRDGQEVNEDQARSLLRARLPAYMVPALLETLPALPALPSGKVDRRALPAPKPRAPRSGAGANHVEPRSDLEKQIAAVWERLFQPQPVSIRDDFFTDLGGHSLLASRMVSELRQQPQFSELAVLDVYKNPTVESLAAHIERKQQAAHPDPDQPGTPVKNRFLPPSARAHFLCGLAQLVALYFVVGFASLFLLGPYLTWGWLEYRYRFPWPLFGALAVAVALYPVMLAAAIAVKWLVIGRYLPGSYPLWGAYFFRWWLVRAVLAVVPVRVLAGTPLLNLYYRLLGAEIGKNVFLETEEIGAYDLVSIGDDAHIGAGTVLSGGVVEDGLLKLAPILIGKRCRIGHRCLVRPGATMKEASSLEDLTLLRSESRVRAGKRRAGSPAAPVSSAPVRADAGLAHGPGSVRRIVFALLAGLCVFIFPVIPLAALVPGFLLLRWLAETLGGGWFLLFTPAATALFIFLFALEVFLLKWGLVGRVKPGRYPRYGWFHFRKWFVDYLMEMMLILLMPLHTSLYQAPWYRLLGARIGRWTELSTAVHVTPDLLVVGEGSFLADSVYLEAGKVEDGHLVCQETRIGNRTFIGNSALLPPGTTIGDNCLVGCLSTPPVIAGETLKGGSSWLGSPAFSLPKRQQSTAFPEEQTFRPTRKLWLKRAAVEAVRILLPGTVGFTLGNLLLLALVAMQQWASWWVVALLLPLLLALSGAAAVLFCIALKWAVMGRYTPRERPLWSGFVWGSELVTIVCEALGSEAVNVLRGTPFICWYFRLLGAKIGKRVYMDTTDLTEFDLVEIGDDVALDDDCIIQTHLFEDRVMKMSRVRIGNRCSVGAGALILYDTHMADGSSLEDLSLLMKGEALPAETAWAGIPAIPAVKTADPAVQPTVLRGPPSEQSTVRAGAETDRCATEET